MRFMPQVCMYLYIYIYIYVWVCTCTSSLIYSKRLVGFWLVNTSTFALTCLLHIALHSFLYPGRETSILYHPWWKKKWKRKVFVSFCRRLWSHRYSFILKVAPSLLDFTRDFKLNYWSGLIHHLNQKNCNCIATLCMWLRR